MGKIYKVLGMRLDPCGMALMFVPVLICLGAGITLFFVDTKICRSYDYGYNHYALDSYCWDAAPAVYLTSLTVLLMFILFASLTTGNQVRHSNRIVQGQALPVTAFATAPPYTIGIPQAGYTPQQQQGFIPQQQGAPHVVNMNQT
ncbi:unnamed protein product [Meganyctiphanes norvegica]|uniref:Uncharacterized protein n=1 Tax=Meganyctiphanes norvegica TaxID=48144 RepID=A0AAV2QFK7_MEGNR